VLGYAIVPLAPPGYAPSLKSGNLPEEYEVSFGTNLVRGMKTKGTGDIKGTITVSYGSMLEAALKKAMGDEAGERGCTLSHYNKFFNCLYACQDLRPRIVRPAPC